ncbi:hypothetical protein BCR37DRAFT_390525 [Protomyces lactucae-debilis]|uniref:FAR1 domain-containing protein n=1 Tax=Protomyces lactucae-debilis TaxID=2754530 RepID=A0A1Y2FVS8_PROLT|nr:uncharacterized protein BCR37DRAFT_390525 [Protomyces lactucae-debilis]ORY86785.1 hypothetical protein BCR37DRAFT_390525 [Protomyces lactucae-debilis]
MDTLRSSIDDALLPDALAHEATTDPALLHHDEQQQQEVNALDSDLGLEHVQAPVVGDRYVSHEQVRLMLDNYARHEGFAVSVRASNKINYRWQCVHSGRYRSTRKDASRNVTLVPDPQSEEGLVAPGAHIIRTAGTGPTGRTRRQGTKRTNCPWLVRAGMDNENLWKITKAVLEHNHVLSPANPDLYHQNREPDQARGKAGQASSIHQVETLMRQPSPTPGLPAATGDNDLNAEHGAFTGNYALGMPGLPVNPFLSGDTTIRSAH